MTLPFALLLLASAALENSAADNCANDVLLLQTQAQVSDRSGKSQNWDSSSSLEVSPAQSPHTVDLNFSALQDELDKALEMPLISMSDIEEAFLEHVGNLGEGSQKPPFTKPDVISCISYHKTGTEVCEALDDHSAYWSAGFTKHPFGGEDIRRSDGDANNRILHFIRHPLDLIVSGFRYHTTRPVAEPWGFEPGQCIPPLRCTESDHDIIFGSCLEDHCAYFNVLETVSSMNETLAVTLDAVVERETINAMLRNTSALVHDPFVLHVTPEHLRTDFNKTMQCMNLFLAGKDVEAERLDELQEFNQGSPTYDSSGGHHFTRDVHETVGKYDNEGIMQFLSSSTAWNAQFEIVSKFYTMVFQRQADMYGCPMP